MGSLRRFSILIVFLVAGLPTVCGAADARSGRGFFMVGWTGLDLDEFNNALKRGGYSEIDDSFVSLGGSGYGTVRRFLVGGEGHALVSDEVRSGDYLTRVEGGYGMLDLGYLLVSSGGTNLYPMVGLGAGGTVFRIRERGPFAFDEILDDPGRGSTLSTWSLLISFDLGLDYLINLNQGEGGTGGVALGIRAGYTLAPYVGGWRMDDVEIDGGPDLGLAGPHVRFMIGGGATHPRP